MGGPERSVQVRVVAGWSETGAFPLTAGTRPVSVGTQGQWIIFGEGVAPVHLYFAFDGTNVYVAPASPAQTVLLGGLPLGAGWATASVPSEVRFGGVTLVLEAGIGATALPPSSGPSSPNTVSDGGKLWEAAQRAVQAAAVVAPQTQQTSQGSPAPAPAPAPPAGAGALASTIVMVPNTAGAILNDAFSSLPAPAPLGQGTALAPSGPGFAVSNQRRSAPPGAMPAPAVMPQETALAPDWGPPQQPPQTIEHSTPASTDSPAKQTFWQSTSTPKKLTLLLMPLLLVASYYLLFAETPHPPAGGKPVATTAPKPPPSSSVANTVGEKKDQAAQGNGAPQWAQETSSRSAASSSRASDASRVATATGVSIGTPPPANAGPGGRNKTAERAALDLAKSGSYEDAARAYESLAAQHPEDPTLREAARILHEKASRPR
jgi:hypothetical protein